MGEEEAGRPGHILGADNATIIFEYLTPLLAIGTLSAAKWASTSLLTWTKFWWEFSFIINKYFEYFENAILKYLSSVWRVL